MVPQTAFAAGARCYKQYSQLGPATPFRQLLHPSCLGLKGTLAQRCGHEVAMPCATEKPLNVATMPLMAVST